MEEDTVLVVGGNEFVEGNMGDPISDAKVRCFVVASWTPSESSFTFAGSGSVDLSWTSSCLVFSTGLVGTELLGAEMSLVEGPFLSNFVSFRFNFGRGFEIGL